LLEERKYRDVTSIGEGERKIPKSLRQRASSVNIYIAKRKRRKWVNCTGRM